MGNSQGKGKYDRISKLGEGAFGVVYKVKERATGQFYAMKMIKSDASGRQERDILDSLPSHDNIVQIWDTFREGKHICLVMEICSGGDLNTFLLRERKDMDRDLRFMAEMASAVNFLHSHGVVHRDLKLENVLVADNIGSPVTKISDFGLSKLLSKKVQDDASQLYQYLGTALGTPLFVAPEVLKEPTRYTAKVDVFSLGVIYISMLEGETISGGNWRYIVALTDGEPIGEMLYRENKRRVLKDSVKVNDSIRKLINAMLEKDYHKRPSANEVHTTLTE